MYSAAGILPITIVDQQFYTLLGNEPTNLGMRWLGFGGKRENVDNDDPLKTAFREFHEESGHIFEDSKVQVFGPSFFDFKSKFHLFLALVPYIPMEQLPSFTDADAEQDPTLNKRQLAWFNLERVLQGREFEYDGEFPIKEWFYRMLQRERYAIRKAVIDNNH